MIGENCKICANTLIENDVIIGDNVIVKSGVYIWDDVRIEDSVFICSCVDFTSDKRHCSKNYPECFLKTIVREGASIWCCGREPRKIIEWINNDE
ncbi:LbetaH domain-containing protein [Escherichia albertii]|uniref:hypothetical protein n=1 Tax=Escherichia albertii TaxID=208962 RepID=UPI001F21A2C1|nr:hypothetical protein [Escherichia albertii]MCU7289877.1 hypothetical protein [Escherichia albertii]